MVDDAQITLSSDQQPTFVKYFIDPSMAEASGRSLSVLVASRQCYMCQQSLDEEETINSDPQDFIDRIGSHCSQVSDFLLPDTPLKETIFRVVLAHGNDPMDAEQISGYVGRKWAMTQFPRDTSPEVIQLLLDSSDFYCLAPIAIS